MSNLEAQDCKPTIRLSSNLENVEYRLNDSLVGMGREIIINSVTGNIKLSARESGKKWNPQTLIDSLVILRCEEYKKIFNFSSDSFIETEPGDAKVYSKDSLLGFTPLYIEESVNNLRIVKEGYREVDLTTSQLGERVNLERMVPVDDKRFYEKSLFKYLIGGILVFGATTAYYKLHADKIYQEYLLTGNASLLNDIRKYDLISGISFAALQVNFGLLLFYFLSE